MKQNNMKNILQSMFSERLHNGKYKVCARRVVGVFGFLFCVTATVCGADSPLLHTALITSAGLLGLTTFDYVSDKKNDR
jgi:hypothetical protein